jgi:tRNA dimethylallyltransferase
MAIELAKQFNGEIICADSRTVYKGMDIGTAKPTLEEQKVVPHHLLDVVNIGEQFSVADFKKQAMDIIKNVQARGKLSFLVGGSGLYIDSVLFDYLFERDNKVTKIDSQKLSLVELQSRVELEFPEIELNNSDAHNRRRLEQILSHGMVKSNDRKEQKIESLVLGLELKMPTLKQNIALRTKAMLNNGFIQEVEKIEQRYGADCAQLQTTGYKEVMNYLVNNQAKVELEEAINTATYKLAKKQITWFKRNPNILWIRNYSEAKATLSDYLKL